MTRSLPLTAVVALALAASPAAAQQDFPGLPGLGGPAKSFAEMADLSARVVPKEAKRGDVVTYEITVKPKRGAWTYPVNPPDPTQSRTRFAFPVAADKGTKPEDVVLVLAEPVADPPGATWEDHPDNGKVARVSYKPVKWELKAINGQSAALTQRIADMEIARQDELIAEAEQAAWQQAQFWMQNNLFIIPTASGTHSTKYPLVWPLQQGTITQLFGPSTLVFEPPGFGYAHFHTGVDISFTQGTPILAADDGIVVAAASSTMNGQLVGYGNYVILAHRNNFFSLYGHLLGFTVKAGDTVHQGQPIGAEGSTGNSTGPHVHFEYRYGGQPTNPMPYLPPNGPNPFNQ